MDEIEKIKNDYTKIAKQVQSEYKIGLDFVTPERVRKRGVEKKLLPQPTKAGKIVGRALWRFMKLWMSITTMDEFEVFFTYMGGNVPREIQDNTNKVAQFDYRTMNLFTIDWKVRWNIGLYGLGAKGYVGRDIIDKHPIVESVSPLDIIPDPSSMNVVDMKYLGFERRTDLYSLSESEGYFGIKEIIERKGVGTDVEKDLNEYSKLNAHNYSVPIGVDGQVDIYHHFVYFEGVLYLTSWVADRKILVRIIEIEAKTKSQKLDKRKIKIPFELYRSNPIDGIFFGASFWDEIGQYSDSETVLDNLELILARKLAMGEDKFINTSIVDINSFREKTPGGRVIPVKLGTNDNINNSIFTIPEGNPGNYPGYVNQKNKQKQDEVTAMGSVAFGVSPQGNQTKSEIQTLQQNINTLLSYSMTMMMSSESRFWQIWHEYYIYNMGKNQKKNITITKGGGISDNFVFRKNDFIADVMTLVEVRSKQQEKAKREANFARFQILMGTILPNIEPNTYRFNEVMRKYLELGNLTKDEILKFVPFNIDEIKAHEGLLLLEQGEKPASPKPGEEYETYINYYSFAKDSDVKNEIIQEYIDAKVQEGLATPALPMGGGKVDNIAQAQVGNMLSQQDMGGTQSLQTMK